MKDLITKINDSPFSTVLLGIAFVIIVIVGGIICITDDTYSMEDYTTSVGILAGALGLLGIGRGINSGQEKVAGAEALKAAHEGGAEYDEPPEAPDEEELAQMESGDLRPEDFVEVEIIEGEGPPEVPGPAPSPPPPVQSAPPPPAEPPPTEPLPTEQLPPTEPPGPPPPPSPRRRS